MKLLLLFTISLLSACEGFVVVKGRVIDEMSNQPVANVKIELLGVPHAKVYNSESKEFTDSLFYSDKNGLFIISSAMMGMVNKPKYSVRLSKTGFDTLVIPVTDKTRKTFWDEKDSLYVFRMRKR